MFDNLMFIQHPKLSLYLLHSIPKSFWSSRQVACFSSLFPYVNLIFLWPETYNSYIHCLSSLFVEYMFIKDVCFCLLLSEKGQKGLLLCHLKICNQRITFLKQIRLCYPSYFPEVQNPLNCCPLKLCGNPRWLFWILDPVWSNLSFCLLASASLPLFTLQLSLFTTFQPVFSAPQIHQVLSHCGLCMCFSLCVACCFSSFKSYLKQSLFNFL